jgi:acetylornithine deacetylase/succinyl-diaminopimelate desuccinylase-like protein
MTAPVTPSAIDDRELAELVELLRALIRIRSVNPPGDEILAARYVEQVLADEGLKPTVFEPFPGRGSIVARVHGDGTGGEPLLLLSHLDVVPADPAGWTHEPFGGDLADGYVWGRGAVDMKAMVAMEIQVMRRLARSARAAGRDPASDPIPGLRRDVIFCATADEEAGGWQGADWLVNEHPELLRAAAALNEAGGIAMTYGGVRFYPIQTAEKGFVTYRLHVHGHSGHGSVPTADNAAVLAAQVVTRLAEPGPIRLTEAVSASLARAVPHLTARAASALVGLATAGGREGAGGQAGVGAVSGGIDPHRIEATVRKLCDPVLARTVSAIIRDTVSVGILQAGVKYNVIPGAAEIEIDCRTLPGTNETAMRDELRRRIGEALWARLDVECLQVGPAVEAPLDGLMYPLLEQVVRDHDEQGVPLPFLAPYATDAKHLARIGVPTYGFSPLRIEGEHGFLALLHADDERIGVEALRWGMPVLGDAVARFCG